MLLDFHILAFLKYYNFILQSFAKDSYQIIKRGTVRPLHIFFWLEKNTMHLKTAQLHIILITLHSHLLMILFILTSVVIKGF